MPESELDRSVCVNAGAQIHTAVVKTPTETVIRYRGEVSCNDALTLLDVATAVESAAHQALVYYVDLARGHGFSWAEIAEVLGIANQAAEDRFGHLIRQRSPLEQGLADEARREGHAWPLIDHEDLAR